MNYVIETKDLIKTYGTKNAVDHVNVHVEAGDIYGLIGKNGAGKTTLMRLLLGLAAPTSGEMELFGSGELNRGRAKIGSLIEEPGLYKNCTAMENLKRFSLLYPDVKEEEMKELLEFVGLSNTGKKKVGGFSLGMRQRLGIAIALMGKPDMLILDEPINGLDPTGIKEIRDIIVEMNQKGTTFMISSHLLDELGKIATRYGIMADGELVEEITAEELKQRCRKHILAEVDNAEKAAQILSDAFPEIRLECEAQDNENQNVKILSEVEDTSEISRLLIENGIKLYSLGQQGTAFEDFFIQRLGVNK